MDTGRALGVIAALAVAASCGGHAAQQRSIEESRRASIAAAGYDGMTRMVSPSCDDSSTSPAPPSSRPIAYKGQKGRQPCGLIFIEITSERYVKNFIRDVCNGQDGPECNSSFLKMFLARMNERYAFADWASLLNKCQAYPVECTRWIKLEYWAISSHNTGVADWTRRNAYEADARHRAQAERAYEAEAERRKNIAAAIQGFGEGLTKASSPQSTTQPESQRSVNCTSQTVGSMTTTSCY